MRLFILILILAGGFLPRIVEANSKFFVPKNPKPNAALFVVMHGCLSDAEAAEKSTRMSEFGEQLGFYVYYPEPMLGPDVSKGCFEFYTSASQKVGGGDAAKIMEDIHSFQSQYDIDTKKTYVMGMSGGASLVSVIMSCYPDEIQGAAIHSGMGYGLASNWQESLLVAQAGPIPLKARNKTCNISDYKGKLMLVQGSRDMVMNPRHYDSLISDFLGDTEKNTDVILPKNGYWGYLDQKFFKGNELRGKGIFVLGMNHEWSGYKSINPIGPLGPDVSKMIVEYFLGINISE